MSRRDPKRLADALGTETEESCTTYNMLKVLHFSLAIVFAELFEFSRTPIILLSSGKKIRYTLN